MKRSGHLYLKDAVTNAVSAYNSSVHSVTGMSPNEAHLKENRNKVFKTLEVKRAKQDDKYIKEYGKLEGKYKVGDYVRKKEPKFGFQKESVPSWSVQLYKIHAIVRTSPTLSYKLIDPRDNTVLPGSFSYLQIKKP